MAQWWYLAVDNVFDGFYSLGNGSPLIEAASRGDIDMVDHMLDCGADIHHMEGYTTVLNTAFAYRHYDLVIRLITRGASSNRTIVWSFIDVDHQDMLRITAARHQWSPIDHHRMPRAVRNAVCAINTARDLASNSVIRLMSNELLFALFSLL